GPPSEDALNVLAGLARARERDATPRAPHEHRLSRTWPVLLLRPDAVPGVVELPGRRGVREQGVDRGRDLALGADVLERDDDLDAVVEVARHEVRAPEIEPVLVAGLEVEEPAVLEEAAEHAPDANGVAHLRHAGPQRADAADDQVDARAGLGGGVQLVDDL